MAEKKQDDQLEHTYRSYVNIRNVALKNLPEAMNDREKWRERVRIPVLAARHDDDYGGLATYVDLTSGKH